jgi:opacity protein-like surface antigen
MKTTLLKLALGLTVAAMGAMPAGAGDYGGGLKGLRGSYVPVPAPHPIPDYRAKWYLRGDLGVGFNTGVDLSPRGLESPMPLVYDARVDGGDDVGFSFGLGAGYYFSNNFRMDLTFDFRKEKDASVHWQVEHPIQVTARDRVSLQSGIFLANAYYDMNQFGRLRPYIGGGIGFAINDLDREGKIAGESNSISLDSDTSYTFAAQATAGVSYQVRDGTHLDFNYRYLFVGGTESRTSVYGVKSIVDIEDQHEHYLRAGLRWDIN